MTKRRIVVKLLLDNGFWSIGGTNHEIFIKPGFRVQVKRHREIEDEVFERIKREAGLK